MLCDPSNSKLSYVNVCEFSIDFPVSSICNACYPFTSANSTPTCAAICISNATSSMEFVPFPLESCRFLLLSSSILLFHSCMGRWVIPVPSPCWHGPYSQEAVSECLHEDVIQENLHWSHLRYILIESKKNLGSLAHTEVELFF